jgi:hypothetical protein
MQKRYFRQQIRYFILVVVLFWVNNSFSGYRNTSVFGTIAEASVYDQLHLSALGLKQGIFEKALAGWKKLKDKASLKNDSILSIADLSQSSTAKRLYIIDMENREVLFNTYVAHGRNSGLEYASSFANKSESYKSSLGFYLTGDTYQGAHGSSLRLIGYEKGINDLAEQRGIVVHGAPYVSETFIRQTGRLGRSQGCPAVPEDLCVPIVQKIKGGSCFFMFYPDSNYLKGSEMLGGE